MAPANDIRVTLTQESNPYGVTYRMEAAVVANLTASLHVTAEELAAIGAMDRRSLYLHRLAEQMGNYLVDAIFEHTEQGLL